MEKTQVKSDLIITIKQKRKPGFKASADLTDKVNLVDVEIDEDVTEEAENISIKIYLQKTAESGKETVG